ncbi:MAG: helix-turn-helix transcriptional regulator [Clostridia bacterium]
MAFSDRLKEQRLKANLKQTELAKLIGITCRTVQNYEAGASTPKTMASVTKIADALNIPTSVLLTDKDLFVIDAYEKGGAKASRDISELVTEVSGLFAGGTLKDEDIDGAMKALNDAYWKSKEKNKKYTPKKYL